MSNKKYKNHGVPIAPLPYPAEIPPAPPRPISLTESEPKGNNQFLYEICPVQLGMPLSDMTRLIKCRLDDCASRGYRYCDRIQVNISEAVLIFEKMNDSN